MEHRDVTNLFVNGVFSEAVPTQIDGFEFLLGMFQTDFLLKIVPMVMIVLKVSVQTAAW